MSFREYLSSSKLRRSGSIGLLISLLVLLELVIAELAMRGYLLFDRKIEAVAFFTVAGFAIVVFQLWQGYAVQRAKFLTDYLAMIYTDKDLSGAFHDLVETYSDKIFEQVDQIATAQKARETSEQNNAPVFDIFDTIQGPRLKLEGQRYYHPDCFQGSEEERKLDGLIGYLDIVGYHYYYGLIRMKDLAAVLNYQLAALSSRKVIARYLKASGQGWWGTTAMGGGAGGAPLPYLYFRNLLGDYVTNNEQHQARLTKEQHKIATKIRNRYL
jgi:hypothetical protein